MSRKDMENKQADQHATEERKASPWMIALFVLGLLGVGFLGFWLVWTITDSPKPGLGAVSLQSVSGQVQAKSLEVPFIIM